MKEKILIVHGMKTPSQMIPALQGREQYLFNQLNSDPAITDLNEQWQQYFSDNKYDSQLFTWSGMFPFQKLFVEDAKELARSINTYQPTHILAHSLGTELTCQAADMLESRPNMLGLAPVMKERAYALRHLYSEQDYLAKLGNNMFFPFSQPFSNKDIVIGYKDVMHEHFLPERVVNNTTIGEVVESQLSKML